MPRTSKGILDEQPLLEGRTVVCADGADGEHFLATPCNECTFAMCVPEQHCAIRDCRKRDSLREIRSAEGGFVHSILPDAIHTVRVPVRPLNAQVREKVHRLGAGGGVAAASDTPMFLRYSFIGRASDVSTAMKETTHGCGQADCPDYRIGRNTRICHQRGALRHIHIARCRRSPRRSSASTSGSCSVTYFQVTLLTANRSCRCQI